jgi:hypothetical protein
MIRAALILALLIPSGVSARGFDGPSGTCPASNFQNEPARMKGLVVSREDISVIVPAVNHGLLEVCWDGHVHSLQVTTRITGLDGILEEPGDRVLGDRRDIVGLAKSKFHSDQFGWRFPKVVYVNLKLSALALSSSARQVSAFYTRNMIGGELSSVGGSFGINQAFADQAQLTVKEPKLDRTNYNQTQSQNSDRVSRALPPSFLLLLVSVGIFVFGGTVWITGRPLR